MEALALNFAGFAMMPPPTVPQLPRPERVGLVKRIWLLLYSEGGRWSAAEIRQRLHLATEITDALREMVDRGFLVRTGTATNVQYGVEKRCKVPRGVQIAEIEEMLAMGLGVKKDAA